MWCVIQWAGKWTDDGIEKIIGPFECEETAQKFADSRENCTVIEFEMI